MANVQTYKKFFLGFDRHTPDHDPKIDKIVTEFLADFKPQIRVAGGDFQNCDQITSFPNETNTPLKREFRMNRDILRKWKITHYLEGNHEARLRRVGLADPRLRSLLDIRTNLELDNLGIEFLPYHKKKGVLRLGHLKVLHGFYTNEYVAAKTVKTYGSCVFGHTHRFQTFWPKEAFVDNVGYAIGMLGSLDQTYTGDRAPMGWAQGFAYGYLYKNGWYDLYTVRIIGNKITINNKTYSKRGK